MTLENTALFNPFSYTEIQKCGEYHELDNFIAVRLYVSVSAIYPIRKTVTGEIQVVTNYRFQQFVLSVSALFLLR